MIKIFSKTGCRDYSLPKASLSSSTMALEFVHNAVLFLYVITRIKSEIYLSSDLRGL